MSRLTVETTRCPSLPPIGSSHFFPALLAQLRTSPSIDPSLLQSILLCLIAGDKHLILRTQEADVGNVAKVAAITLASVFAYPTHRLKIKPPPPSPPDPQGFLRSLFLPYSYHPSLDDASGRKHTHRSPTLTKTRSYTRSYSYPNELGYVASQIAVPTSSPVSNTVPRRSFHSASSSKTPALVQNEISPHNGSDEIDTHTGLELPRALVVSGLEHAGTAAQRALIQVLTEKRVVLENEMDIEQERMVPGHSHSPRGLHSPKGKGKSTMEEEYNFEPVTCPLPEGFLLIYVCPLDPWERPAIHKSLLDRFAMSISVSLRSDIRHGLHSSSFSRSSARQPSTPSSMPPSPGPSHFLSQSHEPLFPHGLLDVLRDHYNNVYMAPKLALYTSDLFSAARHHQCMDGTLLTVRARRDADSLVKACRVLGLGGEVTASLTEPPREQSEENKAQDKVESAEGAVNHLRSSFSEYDQRPVLDISEADIARIVPRVIAHRLRVFDSPEDEVHATAFFGAFQADREKPDKMFEGWVRSTVKDILAEILSDV